MNDRSSGHSVVSMNPGSGSTATSGSSSVSVVVVVAVVAAVVVAERAEAEAVLTGLRWRSRRSLWRVVASDVRCVTADGRRVDRAAACTRACLLCQRRTDWPLPLLLPVPRPAPLCA